MTTGREVQGQGAPRRERILAAALREFSHKGFHGGSTATIAEAAGGSHPGLFQTFPTKKRLFLAVLEQVFTTIEQELAVADQVAEGERRQVAVMTWRSLMEERELMLLLIQGYAASGDSDIHDRMYRWTREAFERPCRRRAPSRRAPSSPRSCCTRWPPAWTCRPALRVRRGRGDFWPPGPGPLGSLTFDLLIASAHYHERSHPEELTHVRAGPAPAWQLTDAEGGRFGRVVHRPPMTHNLEKKLNDQSIRR